MNSKTSIKRTSKPKCGSCLYGQQPRLKEPCNYCKRDSHYFPRKGANRK